MSTLSNTREEEREDEPKCVDFRICIAAQITFVTKERKRGKKRKKL
jgi:hypothetical protein